MGKSKTDAEIVQAILHAVNETAPSLAKRLGYKSHNTVYNLINGATNINAEFKMKLTNEFPYVNRDFIDTGRGSVILEAYEKAVTAKEMAEIYRIKAMMYLPEEVSEIKKNIQNIDSKLDRVISMLEMKK